MGDQGDQRLVWQLVLGYGLVLLREARKSATRARASAEREDAEGEAGAAAAAILCAAAACEALLSEELASNEHPYWDNGTPALVHTVRRARSAANRWKRFLSIAAPGLDVGSLSEYDRLVCVFRIRDHVAHRSARVLPVGEWPKPLEGCVRKHKIPIRPAQDADWTSMLFVHEVAAWVVEVAERWFEFVLPHMPHARMAEAHSSSNPREATNVLGVSDEA